MRLHSGTPEVPGRTFHPPVPACDTGFLARHTLCHRCLPWVWSGIPHGWWHEGAACEGVPGGGARRPFPTCAECGGHGSTTERATRVFPTCAGGEPAQERTSWSRAGCDPLPEGKSVTYAGSAPPPERKRPSCADQALIPERKSPSCARRRPTLERKCPSCARLWPATERILPSCDPAGSHNSNFSFPAGEQTPHNSTFSFPPSALAPHNSGFSFPPSTLALHNSGFPFPLIPRQAGWDCDECKSRGLMAAHPTSGRVGHTASGTICREGSSERGSPCRTGPTAGQGLPRVLGNPAEGRGHPEGGSRNLTSALYDGTVKGSDTNFHAPAQVASPVVRP